MTAINTIITFCCVCALMSITTTAHACATTDIQIEQADIVRRSASSIIVGEARLARFGRAYGFVVPWVGPLPASFEEVVPLVGPLPASWAFGDAVLRIEPAFDVAP
jgi:hypothetical protein